MKTNAFTLVEMIVWITVSMILMVSVGIFISGWIKSITIQEKLIESSSDFRGFSVSMNNMFSRINIKSWAILTNSGVILRQYKEFNEGWFSYVWFDIIPESYCETDIEFPDLDPNTNHIFMKSFIPFEEKAEDIFNNDNILESEPITVAWNDYKSYQKEHVIKDSSNNIVVWKWVFWDKFEEGAFWTWVYLNSPTWLASDWTLLFISDSLNNRILAYNTSNKKIYSLLDEKNGLIEPTGLYYESNTLYIVNSGKGEILKYTSDSLSNELDLKLIYSWVSLTGIDKIEIDFFKNWIAEDISWFLKNDFSFVWFNWADDFLQNTNNNSEYYFVSYAWSESSQADCTWAWEILGSSWIPIDCVSSWTWHISIPVNIDIESADVITITNINLANFLWTGSNYINLKFLDWTSVEYSDYFPYFTQSDDDLLTKEDNTLSVFKSWLNYPTGIWWTWISDYSEFLDWTYDDLGFDKGYDYKLYNPISNLSIDYTDSLLNIGLKYYKHFNCYDSEERVERSFILKKSFK